MFGPPTERALGAQQQHPPASPEVEQGEWTDSLQGSIDESASPLQSVAQSEYASDQAQLPHSQLYPVQVAKDIGIATVPEFDDPDIEDEMKRPTPSFAPDGAVIGRSCDESGRVVRTMPVKPSLCPIAVAQYLSFTAMVDPAEIVDALCLRFARFTVLADFVRQWLIQWRDALGRQHGMPIISAPEVGVIQAVFGELQLFVCVLVPFMLRARNLVLPRRLPEKLLTLFANWVPIIRLLAGPEGAKSDDADGSTTNASFRLPAAALGSPSVDGANRRAPTFVPSDEMVHHIVELLTQIRVHDIDVDSNAGQELGLPTLDPFATPGLLSDFRGLSDPADRDVTAIRCVQPAPFGFDIVSGGVDLVNVIRQLELALPNVASIAKSNTLRKASLGFSSNEAARAHKAQTIPSLITFAIVAAVAILHSVAGDTSILALTLAWAGVLVSATSAAMAIGAPYVTSAMLRLPRSRRSDNDEWRDYANEFGAIVTASITAAVSGALGEERGRNVGGAMEPYQAQLPELRAMRREMNNLLEVTSQLGAVIFVQVPDEAVEALAEGIQFPIDMLDAVLIPAHGTVVWAPGEDVNSLPGDFSGFHRAPGPSSPAPQLESTAAPEDTPNNLSPIMSGRLPARRLFSHCATVMVLTANSGAIVHVTESIRRVFPDISPVSLMGRKLSDILVLTEWGATDSAMCRRVGEIQTPDDCPFRRAPGVSLQGCVVSPLFGLVRWGRRRAADEPTDPSEPHGMPGVGYTGPDQWPRVEGDPEMGTARRVSVPFVGTTISFAAYYNPEASDPSSLANLVRGIDSELQGPLNMPSAAKSAATHASSDGVFGPPVPSTKASVLDLPEKPITLDEAAQYSSRIEPTIGEPEGRRPMSDVADLARYATANRTLHLLQQAFIWTNRVVAHVPTGTKRGSKKSGSHDASSAAAQRATDPADLSAKLIGMGYTVSCISAVSPPAPNTKPSPAESPQRGRPAQVPSASVSVARKQVRIDTGAASTHSSAPASPNAPAYSAGARRQERFHVFATKLRVALFAHLGELHWRHKLNKAAKDVPEDKELASAAAHAEESPPGPPIVFLTPDIPVEEMEHIAQWFTHAFVCILTSDADPGAGGAAVTTTPPPSLNGAPSCSNVVYLAAQHTQSDLIDIALRAADYWRASEEHLCFDPAQEGFWTTDSPSLTLGERPPRRKPLQANVSGSGFDSSKRPGTGAPVGSDMPGDSLGIDGDHAARASIVAAVDSNRATVDQMGSGAFSIVYHIKGLSSGLEFAMKRIVLYSPSDRAQWTSGTEEQHRNEIRRSRTSSFETEASSFLSLDHPNICRTYFAHEYTLSDKVTQHVDIYMEYCEGGTLATQCRSSPTTPDSLYDLSRGILQGLNHLHKQGIGHLDIKPENVLFRDGVPKLADFGVARRQRNGEPWEGIELGTRNYMAPEVIINSAVASRADIFSFGVLLAQMLHLIPEHLLGEGVYDTVISRIRRIFSDRQQFSATYSMRLFFNTGDTSHEVATSLSQERLAAMGPILSLLSHCLCVVPDERLTAARLLELDILTDRALFVTQVEALVGAALQFEEKHKRRALASNALSFNSQYRPSTVPNGGELTSAQATLQTLLREAQLERQAAEAAEAAEVQAAEDGVIAHSEHTAAPVVAMPGDDPDYSPFTVDTGTSGDAFSGLRSAAVVPALASEHHENE